VGHTVVVEIFIGQKVNRKRTNNRQIEDRNLRHLKENCSIIKCNTSLMF